MKEETKLIKEHIARAKSYTNKMELLKALRATVDALGALKSATTVMGRERFELDILFDELFRSLCALEQFEHVFPDGVRMKKGQEKALHQKFLKIYMAFKEAIEKAEEQKGRERANAIDDAMLAGQKALDAGDTEKARKIFRKVSEKYADQPGIFNDVGSRMMKGGLAQESVEYLERAIKQDQRDPRPYAHLVDALEQIGELNRAEHYVTEALKNFGATDRTYIRQAKLYLHMKRWDDAYNAATAAQDANPFNQQATKILKEVEPRVFGRGADGGMKKGKDGKKVYDLGF